jgi:hypothetical protein
MEHEHIWIGGIVAVLALLFGSCVHDFAKSTPQVSEVTIVDKHHQPEYWSTHCTSDNKGRMSCYPQYHPPSWRIRYEDGAQRFGTSVSSGTFNALNLGDRKVLRYALGGGIWGARYGERFVFGPMTGEASWPAR